MVEFDDGISLIAATPAKLEEAIQYAGLFKLFLGSASDSVEYNSCHILMSDLV